MMRITNLGLDLLHELESRQNTGEKTVVSLTQRQVDIILSHQTKLEKKGGKLIIKGKKKRGGQINYEQHIKKFYT